MAKLKFDDIDTLARTIYRERRAATLDEKIAYGAGIVGGWLDRRCAGTLASQCPPAADDAAQAPDARRVDVDDGDFRESLIAALACVDHSSEQAEGDVGTAAS